ncbi:hypothetical protein TNIN_268841 [Trichonephila inaurata madagascariensis]|uniref:Uncharacterized protein n=1 Tax=Trichonephila inaurata madagascariensis TaxID=2747483 RepID=A0A8X6XE89_9ARAC|nr:hypothetical protein TNIN_268841 [Trichonephila inaurata madagascariensis]
MVTRSAAHPDDVTTAGCRAPNSSRSEGLQGKVERGAVRTFDMKVGRWLITCHNLKRERKQALLFNDASSYNLM